MFVPLRFSHSHPQGGAEPVGSPAGVEWVPLHFTMRKTYLYNSTLYENSLIFSSDFIIIAKKKPIQKEKR